MKIWRMPEAEKDALREMNKKNFKAVHITEYFGRTQLVCSVCTVMRSTVFVLPGETRWKCQKCGMCCTGMEGKLTLPSEVPKNKDGSCAYFNRKKKRCKVDKDKCVTCKMWPFSYVYDGEKHPDPIIVINPICKGFGKGPIITDETYNKLQNVVLRGKQIREAFE